MALWCILVSSSIPGMEADKFLWVQGQPGLHSEILSKQTNKQTPKLNKTKQKLNNKKPQTKPKQPPPKTKQAKPDS